MELGSPCPEAEPGACRFRPSPSELPTILSRPHCTTNPKRARSRVVISKCALNRAVGNAKLILLTNSDLSSHAVNQLLGIEADPGLKHRLDVLDLVNSF